MILDKLNVIVDTLLVLVLDSRSIVQGNSLLHERSGEYMSKKGMNSGNTNCVGERDVQLGLVDQHGQLDSGVRRDGDVGRSGDRGRLDGRATPFVLVGLGEGDSNLRRSDERHFGFERKLGFKQG